MPPPILYKYAKAAAVSYILQNQKLSFTSLAELNDPFEGGMDLSDLVRESLASKDEIARAAVGLPPSQVDRGMFLKVFEQDGFTQEILDAIAARQAWMTLRVQFSWIEFLAWLKSLTSCFFGHTTRIAASAS